MKVPKRHMTAAVERIMEGGDTPTRWGVGVGLGVGVGVGVGVDGNMWLQVESHKLGLLSFMPYVHT
jgi:hypothetical protein